MVGGQSVPDSLKYRSLGPAMFQQQYLSEDTALLIDVREYFEYKGNRIKGAVNIPASGNLEFASDTITKSIPLYFYCTSGFRSNRVAKFFYDKGFRDLYSLNGGISGWRKEGLRVEKKRPASPRRRH